VTVRYRHAGTLAGRGSGDTHFRGALRALALDARGCLHAAGDAEIKVFAPDGGLERCWATTGPVHAVAIAPDGRVFTGGQGRIEIFREDGRPLAAWRDAERLGVVTAIGFSGGDVLAADAQGRGIRRFGGDGRFVNDIGLQNPTRGFRIPNGVLDFDVDEEGIIHAANPGKHRVERYTPDGRLLGHFGRFGGLDPAGFSGCCNPTNLALGRGRIYVTEKASPRVKVYDQDGRLDAIVATDVFDAGCKNMDIAVNARGTVYVADTVRLAIERFEPEAAA
jgi:hypothetical protein